MKLKNLKGVVQRLGIFMIKKKQEKHHGIIQSIKPKYKHHSRSVSRKKIYLFYTKFTRNSKLLHIWTFTQFILFFIPGLEIQSSWKIGSLFPPQGTVRPHKFSQ